MLGSGLSFEALLVKFSSVPFAKITDANAISAQILDLIKKGQDINGKITDDLTVAHIAALRNDSEFLKVLLEQPNIDLDAVDKDGCSFLHYAILVGDCSTLCVALKALSQDQSRFVERVNLKNKEQETPFDQVYKSKFLNPEKALILMTKGVSPDESFNKKIKNSVLRRTVESFQKKDLEPDNYASNILSISLYCLKEAFQNLEGFPNSSLELIEYAGGQVETLINDAKESPNKRNILELITLNFLKAAGDLAIESEEWLSFVETTRNSIFGISESRNISDLPLAKKYNEHLCYFLNVVQQCVLLHSRCADLKDDRGFTVWHLFAITKSTEAWDSLMTYLTANATYSEALESLVKDSIDAAQTRNVYQFLPSKDFWQMPTVGGSALTHSYTEGWAAKKAVTASQFMRSQRLKNISSFVEQAPPPPPPPPPKTLAEKWQDCLSYLQRNSDKEVSTDRIFALLTGDEAVDVNAKTTNDYTALHIAATLGSSELLKILNTKQANINAKTNSPKTKDNLSVLRCAIDTKNTEVKASLIADVLSRADLDLEIIVSELVSELGNKKKLTNSPAAIILRNEDLISRVSNLPNLERPNLIKTLRSAYKNNSGNLDNFKKIVNDFEEATKNKKEQKAPPVVKVETLSKTQRKALKKAEKEQEEFKKKQEAAVSAVTRESKKIAKEALESAEQQVVNIKDAPEAQMTRFLRGERQINSLQDLPEFLQPTLRKLLENGCQVALKGSAAYLAPNKKRVPSDLDIEVQVNGIGGWPSDEIVKFAQEKLGLEIAPQAIYRQSANRWQGEVFTLNAKDPKLKLDWSIYDPQMPPPLHLSWTTNREPKIFFDQNEQAFRLKTKPELLINRDSRGLILRLCFLQTIGHLSQEEIEGALSQISPESPADLLVRELKIDNFSSENEGEKKAKIVSNISTYLGSHFSNDGEKREFVKNLSHMLERSHCVREVLRAAVEEMVQIFQSPQQQASSPSASQLLMKPQISLAQVH